MPAFGTEGSGFTVVFPVLIHKPSLEVAPVGPGTTSRESRIKKAERNPNQAANAQKSTDTHVAWWFNQVQFLVGVSANYGETKNIMTKLTPGQKLTVKEAIALLPKRKRIIYTMYEGGLGADNTRRNLINQINDFSCEVAEEQWQTWGFSLKITNHRSENWGSLYVKTSQD